MFSVLILFFIFAITMSFLCSLWEAVLLSITPTYAQIVSKEHPFLGKKLKHFKSQIDKPLAAILTLNTIAHTVGAIGVGEQASIIWGHTSPYVTKLVVPFIMTMAILLLSEIIPKTIGANYWKRFVPFTVYSLTGLIKLLYPLVWLCQQLTKFFPKHGAKSVLTRSDFLALTEIGELHGVFEESEADLIEKTLDFYELRVREVMRPASEMVSISMHESIANLRSFIQTHRYTRYPVYDGNTTNIVGIVHAKDLLTSKHSTTIEAIMRPVLKVPEHLPLNNMLKRFLHGMPHFALVYKDNVLFGFVTMDNVLQVLLGIMKDEFHRTHVDWVENKDGTFHLKGRCSTFVLEHLLDITIEDAEDIETVAGLIYKKIDGIPQEGDCIEFDTFKVVIEKMNNAQIGTVLVIPLPENQGDDN